MVLISGGVGPHADDRHGGAHRRRGQANREVPAGLFHPRHQNGRAHAFRDHVLALAAAHPQFKVHVSYSHAGGDDVLGASHDADGHSVARHAEAVLPFGDYDFYLCGPAGFMQSLYEGLTGMGIAVEPDLLRVRSARRPC